MSLPAVASSGLLGRRCSIRPRGISRVLLRFVNTIVALRWCGQLDSTWCVSKMACRGSAGEMQYEDTYRLAYIRGPEGIIVGLAEQLG